MQCIWALFPIDQYEKIKEACVVNDNHTYTRANAGQQSCRNSNDPYTAANVLLMLKKPTNTNVIMIYSTGPEIGSRSSAKRCSYPYAG